MHIPNFNIWCAIEFREKMLVWLRIICLEITREFKNSWPKIKLQHCLVQWLNKNLTVLTILNNISAWCHYLRANKSCMYVRQRAKDSIVGPHISVFFSPKNPGTRGGPGSRDRTLAVKKRKNVRKSVLFFVTKKNYNFYLQISSS